MSMLTKIGDHVNAGNGDGYCHHDGDFESEFPGLWEFLSRIMLEGKPRESGTINIFVEPGKVVLCLQDRHTGFSAFHAAETLQEALEGCEGRFQAGKLDWRKKNQNRR
jgi:hypothetical protein